MKIGELRNRATAYRPTETPDEYADVLSGYAEGDSFWVGIKRERNGLIDQGPGDQPAVTAIGQARFGVDVLARDVLDVVSGPEVGTRWRVLAAFHPAKRHTDLVLEQFTGDLT